MYDWLKTTRANDVNQEQEEGKILSETLNNFYNKLFGLSSLCLELSFVAISGKS